MGSELMNPLSLVNSLVLIGTVMLIVLSVEAFAVNVSIVTEFFWIVSVASFTVGIVGLFKRSV